MRQSGRSSFRAQSRNLAAYSQRFLDSPSRCSGSLGMTVACHSERSRGIPPFVIPSAVEESHAVQSEIPRLPFALLRVARNDGALGYRPRLTAYSASSDSVNQSAGYRRTLRMTSSRSNSSDGRVRRSYAGAPISRTAHSRPTSSRMRRTRSAGTTASSRSCCRVTMECLRVG
jgi:hypothetical protein